MKKKIKWILIIVIILLLDYMYSFVGRSEPIYDKKIDSADYENIGEMVNNTRISQKFVCESNGLNGIQIKFGTYDRTNTSNLNYVILDESGGEVVKGTIDTSIIKNNEFYNINFELIDNSKNREYIFNIHDINASEGNGVTIYSVKTTDNMISYDKVSGLDETHSENGTLIMKINTKEFDIETFIVVLFFVAFIAMFVNLLYRFLK